MGLHGLIVQKNGYKKYIWVLLHTLMFGFLSNVAAMNDAAVNAAATNAAATNDVRTVNS